MGLLNTITSAGSSLYNTVSGGFQQAVSTATSYVSPVASSVQSVVQPVQSAAVRTVQPVVSTVSRAVQPVVSTVTQAVQQAPRVIQQAPQTIQSTIRSVTPQSVARTVIMANPVTASVMLGTDTIRRTVQAVPRVIQAAPRVVTPARTVIQSISPVVSPVSAATVLGLSAARVIKPRIDPIVRDVTRTISKPRPDLVMAAGLPVTNVLSGVVAPKIQSPISAGVRTIIQAPAVQRATRTGGLVVQDIFGTRKAGLASQARQYEVDVAAYNLNVAQRQREAGWLASNVTRANEFIGSRKFSQEEADVINATMIAPLKSWETSLKSNPQYGDAALKNQSRQLNQTAANITAAQKELQSTGLYGIYGTIGGAFEQANKAIKSKIPYVDVLESSAPVFTSIFWKKMGGGLSPGVETGTQLIRETATRVTPSAPKTPTFGDLVAAEQVGEVSGWINEPATTGAFFAVGAGIGGITRGVVGASKSFLARKGATTFADLAKSPAGKKVVGTLTKRAPQLIGGIYAIDVGIRTGSQPTPTSAAREFGRIVGVEAGPMVAGGGVGYKTPEIARGVFDVYAWGGSRVIATKPFQAGSQRLLSGYEKAFGRIVPARQSPLGVTERVPAKMDYSFRSKTWDISPRQTATRRDVLRVDWGKYMAENPMPSGGGWRPTPEMGQMGLYTRGSTRGIGLGSSRGTESYRATGGGKRYAADERLYFRGGRESELMRRGVISPPEPQAGLPFGVSEPLPTSMVGIPYRKLPSTRPGTVGGWYPTNEMILEGTALGRGTRPVSIDPEEGMLTIGRGVSQISRSARGLRSRLVARRAARRLQIRPQTSSLDVDTQPIPTILLTAGEGIGAAGVGVSRGFTDMVGNIQLPSGVSIQKPKPRKTPVSESVIGDWGRVGFRSEAEELSRDSLTRIEDVLMPRAMISLKPTTMLEDSRRNVVTMITSPFVANIPRLGVDPFSVPRTDVVPVITPWVDVTPVQTPRVDVTPVQTPRVDVGEVVINIPRTDITEITTQIPRTDITQITGLQEVTIIPPEIPPVDIFIPPPVVPPFTFPPIGPGGGGGSGNAIPGKGGFVFEETFPLGDFMSDTFGVGGLSLGDAFGLPGKRKSRRRRR